MTAPHLPCVEGCAWAINCPNIAHTLALSLTMAEKVPMACRKTSDGEDKICRYFMCEAGNSGELRNP